VTVEPEAGSAESGIGAGFADVDGHERAPLLLQAMDATAAWPAVRQLRAWEREHLDLRPGHRLLDVGCGLGDAALALATDLAPGGAIVGIDASEQMLAVARQRAIGCPVEMELRAGDATALPADDGSFDAVRSERVLQWLDRPDKAVTEMIRVLRPGGRLVVTDTDWRPFAMDHPDADLVSRVRAGLTGLRPSSAVGGQLYGLARSSGLVDVEATVAAHHTTEWDPDTQPAPSGFPPLRMLVTDLVEQGSLSPDEGDAFVAGAEDYARAGRLFLTLTMVSVTGRRRVR
jgi:SAM-dependent methyltransferase